MKNIKIFGGVFDEGVNGTPTAETSPIQVGATLQLPLGKYGLVDFYVYGANLSSSFAINNTDRFNIQVSVDSPNGGQFKYHAFIQNSPHGNLHINTPLALLVYQENSSFSVNKPYVSSVAPTVSGSGGTVSSQVTTLISSSSQDGELYRINVSGALTLAVGSFMQLDIVGGRTVLDVQGSYLNTVTNEIKPVFYRASGGYVLIKPDTQAALEIVLYVTVA